MSARPRNIGLGSLYHYRFPATAISSILHRASGVLLFIAIPFILWAFAESLTSAHHFAQIQACLQTKTMRFLVWFFGSALIYHFIAGVRHLFMDLGFFESKRAGRLGSWVVFVLSFVLIIGLGVCLW